MRLTSRLLLAVALVVPPAIVAASCSTGAAGVAACTTIEEYRCTIAPTCTPGFDVGACQRFYRDACLNGIQNTTLTVDPSTLAAGCVSALGVVAASATAGGGNDPYPVADLMPDASCAALTTADPTACDIILDCPELLPACNFVASPPDAGTDADAATEDADAATADADAATEDAGDAAGE